MKRLLPVILALFGVVGGAAAGLILKPAPPEAEADPCALPLEEQPAGLACDAVAEEPEDYGGKDASEFFKLDRQFIVPVVEEKRVASLIVLTLSLETAPQASEEVFALEPKIRDSMLRTLFRFSNSGGFDRDFTAEHVMADLRRSLLRAARKIAGDLVRDVLISDIIRQDQ